MPAAQGCIWLISGLMTLISDPPRKISKFLKPTKGGILDQQPKMPIGPHWSVSAPSAGFRLYRLKKSKVLRKAMVPISSSYLLILSLFLLLLMSFDPSLPKKTSVIWSMCIQLSPLCGIHAFFITSTTKTIQDCSLNLLPRPKWIPNNISTCIVFASPKQHFVLFRPKFPLLNSSIFWGSFIKGHLPSILARTRTNKHQTNNLSHIIGVLRKDHGYKNLHKCCKMRHVLHGFHPGLVTWTFSAVASI